jgi:glycosyltransferase involved in cell wall biosynthesis
LLGQAIESVRRQSIPGIETVVVDDGSDEPVADRIRNLDGHIVCARQNNSGLNAARNLGLKMAQGNFIALLDDDDLWLPFKTEIQLAVLDRFPEVSFVFSDFIIFDEGGIKSDKGLSTYNYPPATWALDLECSISAREKGLPLPPDGQDYRLLVGRFYRQLLHGPYVLPSTALVRRTAIKVDSPFPVDNIHCGDWQFFAKLARSSSCAFLTLATAMNRSHGDSVRLTRKSPIVRIRDRISLIEQVWKSDAIFISEHGSEVSKVEVEQLKRLALLCIFENRPGEAIEWLDRWRRLPSAGSGIKWWLLNFAARFPLASHIVRLVRKIMGWMRGLDVT